MAGASAHVLELAKLGARQRLRELAHEVELLIGFFPDLRDSFDPDELPVSFILKRDGRFSAAGEVAPRKRVSSPAARKAVNRRLTQTWTQRRAGSKS